MNAEPTKTAPRPAMIDTTTRYNRAEYLQQTVWARLPWHAGAWMFFFSVAVGLYRGAPLLAVVLGAALVGALAALTCGLLSWYVRAWVRATRKWPRLEALFERNHPPAGTFTHRLPCHRLRWGCSFQSGMLYVGLGQVFFVPHGLGRKVSLTPATSVSHVPAPRLRGWLLPWPRHFLALGDGTHEEWFLAADPARCAGIIRDVVGAAGRQREAWSG
jgi:hypothetical protein